LKANIYFADKPQRTNAESAIRQMRDADVVSKKLKHASSFNKFFSLLLC